MNTYNYLSNPITSQPEKNSNATFIDRLSFTFLDNSFIPKYTQVVDLLKSILPTHQCHVVGSRYYAYRYEYQDQYGNLLFSTECGHRTYDASIRFELTGYGCQQLTDTDKQYLFDLFDSLQATITRIDIAIDQYNSISHFKKQYNNGSFNVRGKKPAKSTYKSNDGDTFYIGNQTSPNQIVIYRRTGEETTRVELRIRNNNTIIPYDTLLNPDNYFAGHSNAMKRLILGSSASKPIRKPKEARTRDSQLAHARNQYGKLFKTCLDEGMTERELMDAIIK